MYRHGRVVATGAVPLTGQFWNQLAGNIQEFALLFRGEEEQELAA